VLDVRLLSFLRRVEVFEFPVQLLAPFEQLIEFEAGSEGVGGLSFVSNARRIVLLLQVQIL